MTHITLTVSLHKATNDTVLTRLNGVPTNIRHVVGQGFSPRSIQLLLKALDDFESVSGSIMLPAPPERVDLPLVLVK